MLMEKCVFIVGLVLLSSVVGFSQQQKWKLVWCDEFNYEGLPDSSKWGYEVGFVRNKEPQYYTYKRLENAYVENGKLIINARKEDYKGAHYTSASLNTQGIAEFQYGRMEMRAKVPKGLGSWPAFWMLGETTTEKSVGLIVVRLILWNTSVRILHRSMEPYISPMAQKNTRQKGANPK